MAPDIGLPENVERAALLKNVPEEIKGLPYFYPKLAGSKEATKFVRDNSNGAGHFVLRLSSKGDDYLAVTISISRQSVRHVNVQLERQPGLQYFIISPLKFNTFQELRKYYTEHCISNAEHVQNVQLLFPINRGYDDREQYEKLNPHDNSSSSVIIPTNSTSEYCLPQTPQSQQLTAEMPEPAGQAEVRDDEEYSDYFSEYRSARLQDREKKKSLSRSISRSGRTVKADVKRPPCPPPKWVADRANLYYSHPSDENKNRLEELRQVLMDSEICDCGIPLVDARLPQGWTLHQSHDMKTQGSLFFQSPTGETSWNLPQYILSELTTQQYNIILSYSRRTAEVAVPTYPSSTRRNNPRELRDRLSGSEMRKSKKWYARASSEAL